ncbi:MAG: hypothetical protein ABIK38_05960 [candidate division WOR-3 bacterium]
MSLQVIPSGVEESLSQCKVQNVQRGISPFRFASVEMTEGEVIPSEAQAESRNPVHNAKYKVQNENRGADRLTEGGGRVIIFRWQSHQEQQAEGCKNEVSMNCKNTSLLLVTALLFAPPAGSAGHQHRALLSV